MKIPINWLKDYVKTEASPRAIASSFTQLGLMLDKPLDNSGVLDLEHRMDRSDWLSIIGCARDYAAFNKLKLHYPKTNTKRLPRVPASQMIEITVNTPHVRRFNTLLAKNVRVGESPAWLKQRLTSYGIKSINNVVDVTNYVMVEYGQPMHAQDTAKLKKREITLRPAKKGESLTTILGTPVLLDKDTFVLSSGGVPTVIGGIVGGQDTGVNTTTTELILDAGNYDQAIIRKTSRRLKIINETVSRYDKFLHPDLCEIALDRATYLLEELTGATIYDNFDYYPNPPSTQSLTLNLSRLTQLSGMNIPISQVKRILTALEYVIKKETKDKLELSVPYFRTDVEVEDDVVADLLRISDYTNIPTTPLTTPVPTDITPPILKFEDTLRDYLGAQGAHEHISASLVKNSGATGEILLSNALSADQNALRTSLIPNLQTILVNYDKHEQSAVTLFEIGKVFILNNQDYEEQRQLGVATNHDARPSLATLLHQLGIKYQVNNKQQIIVDQQVVGSLELKHYTLFTDLLRPHYRPYGSVISEFTHPLTRDLSLLVSPQTTYADLANIIQSRYPNLQLSCKSLSMISDNRNYLLTLTWNSNTKPNPDQELLKIVSLLSNAGVILKS